MSHAPRKIVFNMPSLLPEAGTDAPEPSRRRVTTSRSPGEAEAPGEGATEPADVRKLGTLMEVGQALAGTLNLQAALYAVLEVLERRCGAVRGAVTLLEEASGMLVIEAELGYPRSAGRVRYRIGEGITGRVAASKAPAVVPLVSGEPLFLHRAAGRADRNEEVTFLCVPILLDGDTTGTLSIELAASAERDTERMIEALRITAGMISQSLRSSSWWTPSAGGWSRRTRNSARSCVSATNSPTSSAPAGRPPSAGSWRTMRGQSMWNEPRRSRARMPALRLPDAPRARPCLP